jgi:tetratricopeptide (TPR) repeat protein
MNEAGEADAHYRSAMACCEQGRIAEGIKLARRSLALDPGKARTHRLLGTALLHLGRPADALASLDRAVALAPDWAPAHGARADALSALGRLAEAVEGYDRALALQPASVEDWCNRGAALFELGRFEETIYNCDRIIALAPRFAQAHFNRANALARLGRHAEALSAYDAALAIDPRFADAHNNRANVLDAFGRPGDALLSLDRALAADPAHRGALITRARLLNRFGRAAEALASAEHALARSPDDFEALSARGEALIGLDRFEEAVEAFDRAIAANPGDAGAKWNKSLLCLGLGRLAEGWALYEHRWAAAEGLLPRPYRQPRWNGQALDGTLLLWSEQGGDEILHSGMVPDLAGRVRRTVLEVEPRLVPLFARSFADIEVVPQHRALYQGHVDAQAPLGGLGQYLRGGFESFPNRPQGYLVAEADRAGELRARLAAGRQSVIGLSWISRAPATGEAESSRLADFASLFRLPGCRFVDLQYGDTVAERMTVKRELGIEVERIAEIDNTQDIDGLAALITACDLVVTVSNTTAHLAGALGRTTWVMVPAGDARMWYWHRDRPDSPWYPHLAVRRQPGGQPWLELVSSISCEVATRLEASRNDPQGKSR